MVALASAAAVVLGACGGAAKPRMSAQAAEAGMNAELDAMVSDLGAAPLSTNATVRQYCAMYAENGSAIFLSRFLRLPNAPGSLDAIRTRVVPNYVRQGWRLMDRSSAQEAAFTLERGLYTLGLTPRSDGKGDLVLSGATGCFEPTGS